MRILLTTTEQELKPNCTTAYQTRKETTKIITKDWRWHFVDSCSFFRRLGGTETITRSYTSKGYLPVRLTSKSPDRKYRTIRTFEYLQETTKGNYTIYSIQKNELS